MISVGLFVLVGIFQVISSQGPPLGGPPRFEDIPEKCRRPPQEVENPEECCQVDFMYTEEEMTNCGFKKGGEDFQERRGPPDCSKHICLLEQKDLIDKSTNNVDFSKFEAYLRQWAGEGPFKNTADLAIAICTQGGKVPGPPQVCQPALLMHCVGGVIFANCPEQKWQQTENCKALKEHIEDCKPPFN